MSLFSVENILLNESNNSVNLNSVGYIDTEINNHSFVQEGYDFILELGRDYMNAEKTFIESVLGSYGNNDIINESFSDFFGKIKDAIKKFIDWIKKVFKEFVTKLNSLVSNEAYLKKNKNLFNKFESQDEFEYNGYNFTHINESTVPAANALEAFASENDGANYLTDDNWYSSHIDIPDTYEDARKRQTDALNTRLDAKLDALNNGLEDFYDGFRGRVIGKSEKIDSGDYANELFEFFRDGDSSPSSITIDATYVMDAYRRFDNYKDAVKSIEKTQKEIVKDYEALEKYLDKMLKVNKADTKNMKLQISDPSSNSYVSQQIDDLGGRDLNDKLIYHTSTSDKMNSYLKVQSSKVNQMCSIHTQAFSAKLEAAKDQFKQDKKILYKALQKIVKRSNKPGF